MAAKKSPSTIALPRDFLNELECSVCTESKTLHILPKCQHKYCQRCIHQLAGTAGRFNCPVCRRDTVVPPEGFAVCRLSERLREQLLLCANTEQKEALSRNCCQRCSKEVQIRCDQCHQFLCYQCCCMTKCLDSSLPHIAIDIQTVLKNAQTRFVNGWKKSEEDQVEKWISEVERLLSLIAKRNTYISETEQSIAIERDPVKKISLIERIVDSSLQQNSHRSSSNTVKEKSASDGTSNQRAGQTAADRVPVMTVPTDRPTLKRKLGGKNEIQHGQASGVEGSGRSSSGECEIAHDKGKRRAGNSGGCGKRLSKSVRYSPLVIQGSASRSEHTSAMDQPATSQTVTPSEVAATLERMIIENHAENQPIFDWIDSRLSHEQIGDPSFIRSITTSVVKSCICSGGTSQTLSDMFKFRMPLILKYCESKSDRQLVALSAIEDLMDTLHHPANFFNELARQLHEGGVIGGQSFLRWARHSKNRIAVKSMGNFLERLNLLGE